MEPSSPHAAPAPDLIALVDVSREFDGGAVVALRHVDLHIPAGDCLAIVGASGSGKSSLINMLSGIDAPSGGRVIWRGAAVTSRRAWTQLRSGDIGIVFQEFNLLPTLTAIDIVELAQFGRGRSAIERRTQAAAALERVGLGARLNHLPNAMSGGERQRVAIARSVVNAPKLLLADEPTGNLDSANAAMIADLLIGLQETTGTTLVLVTHDETLARRCRRQIRIKDGSIVEDRAWPPAAQRKAKGAPA
jgi:putative ABC transport system ATP-binding protein